MHFKVQVLITFGQVFDLTGQLLNIDLKPISLIKFGPELPVQVIDLNDSRVQMLLGRLQLLLYDIIRILDRLLLFANFILLQDQSLNLFLQLILFVRL